MATQTTICAITGTRAEYGLLKPLLREIKQHTAFQLKLIVTGTHLSREYGSTYEEIEADNFSIDAKLDILLSSDSEIAIAKSTGLAVIGFADAIGGMKPDFVLILGDRYEALAAAQTAMLLRIPIIHLHGGELTQGAVDESIRHAITKMASLHFVATAEYRNRVLQLGENPDRVFNVGALGVENIHQTKLLSRQELATSLGASFGSQLFLATYHPATLSEFSPAQAMAELTKALDTFTEATIIFTYPNSDSNSRQIVSAIQDFALAQSGRVIVEKSLGLVRYLSTMSHADIVIGNSSSGIIEAPSLKTPTVNIGDRQAGRTYAKSVIHCEEKAEDIIKAITKALSDDFRQVTAQVENPYDGGRTSKTIVAYLMQLRAARFVDKEFFDI